MDAPTGATLNAACFDSFEVDSTGKFRCTFLRCGRTFARSGWAERHFRVVHLKQFVMPKRERAGSRTKRGSRVMLEKLQAAQTNALDELLPTEVVFRIVGLLPAADVLSLVEAGGLLVFRDDQHCRQEDQDAWWREIARLQLGQSVWEKSSEQFVIPSPAWPSWRTVLSVLTRVCMYCKQRMWSDDILKLNHWDGNFQMKSGATESGSAEEAMDKLLMACKGCLLCRSPRYELRTLSSLRRRFAPSAEHVMRLHCTFHPSIRRILNSDFEDYRDRVFKAEKRRIIQHNLLRRVALRKQNRQELAKANAAKKRAHERWMEWLHLHREQERRKRQVWAVARRGGQRVQFASWVEYETDHGRPYFANQQTGTVQWERPNEGRYVVVCKHIPAGIIRVPTDHAKPSTTQ